MNDYIKIGNKLKLLEPYIHFDGVFNLFILIFNLKSISRLENINNIDKLIKEIDKMGFFYHKYNDETLYVSKTDNNLRKSIYYDLDLGDDYKFGEMLGFPKCCVKKFCDFGGVRDNNIFEYIKNTNNIKKASNYLNIFENKLIYHIPCSFHCEESINIGKKLINIYLLLINNKEINKDYLLEETKYILFRNLDWISIHNDKYTYGNLINKNIINNKYINNIKNGYSVRVLGNNKAELFTNDSIIYINDYIILDFNGL